MASFVTSVFARRGPERARCVCKRENDRFAVGGVSDHRRTTRPMRNALPKRLKQRNAGGKTGTRGAHRASQTFREALLEESVAVFEYATVRDEEIVFESEFDDEDDEEDLDSRKRPNTMHDLQVEIVFDAESGELGVTIHTLNSDETQTSDHMSISEAE
mmetsp:Transcript_5857/g.17574  ORF Transcript_5857/g.17574 Transcript_5857/m.17574 type:complete len:159 (-) Transcript_5857:3364-3840(-)